MLARDWACLTNCETNKATFITVKRPNVTKLRSLELSSCCKNIGLTLPFDWSDGSDCMNPCSYVYFAGSASKMLYCCLLWLDSVP